MLMQERVRNGLRTLRAEAARGVVVPLSKQGNGKGCTMSWFAEHMFITRVIKEEAPGSPFPDATEVCVCLYAVARAIGRNVEPIDARRVADRVIKLNDDDQVSRAIDYLERWLFAQAA